MVADLAERLAAHSTLDPATGCRVWSACIDADGYGRVHVDGRTRRAHRVAYELHVGTIPAGLDLDHLCRNRACVNPAHLEPVTRRENSLRGVGACARHACKTHCRAGHALAGDNVRVEPGGGRRCKRCDAAKQRAYQARRAELAPGSLA